jgi:hypothetical protein
MNLAAGVTANYLEAITLGHIQGRDQRPLNGIGDRRALRLRPHVKHIDLHGRHAHSLARAGGPAEATG